MAQKVCPTCKVIRECSLIDEGFHHNVYKCSVCSTDFEKEGTGKKALQVLGGIFGGILAIVGIDAYNDRHHNK